MTEATATWPTRAELVTSVANRSLTIADPVLSAARIELSPLGSPQCTSGANGIVFDLDSQEGRIALKCFTAGRPDRSQRYAAIAAALADLKQPWVIPTDYLPVGLATNAGAVPLLKMPWVDGVELSEWLREHIWEQRRVATVAASFARAVVDLGAAGLAHGDLQHGNILVTSEDRVVLVDYDGMFVPSIAALGPCEAGHPAYQSPRRTGWGDWLDRYSARTIYASLAILAIDPSVFFTIDGAGQDRLLLSETDHRDLEGSDTIARLRANRSPEIQGIVNELVAAGRPDPASLRPFDPAEIADLDAVGWWDASPAADGAGDDDEADARRARDAATADETAGGSAAGVQGEDGDAPAARASAPDVVRLVLVGAVAVALTLTIQFGAVGGLAGVAAVGLLLWAWWWSQPAVRAHRQRRAALASARIDRRKADARVEQLRAVVRKTSRQGAVDLRALEDAQQAVLRQRAVDLAAIDEDLRAELDAIRRKQERTDEADVRLVGEARASVIADERERVLSAVRLADHPIPGVGGQLVALLASAGIETAADITWSPDRVGEPTRVKGPRHRGAGVVIEPRAHRALALWVVEHDVTLDGTSDAVAQAHIAATTAATDGRIALAEATTDAEVGAAARRAACEAEVRTAIEDAARRMDDLRIEIRVQLDAATGEVTDARSARIPFLEREAKAQLALYRSPRPTAGALLRAFLWTARSDPGM